MIGKWSSNEAIVEIYCWGKKSGVKTSWGWQVIPLSIRFFTSQRWLFGFLLSTVSVHWFPFKTESEKRWRHFFGRSSARKTTTLSLSMNLGVGDFMPHLLAQKAGKVVDPNGSQTPRKTQKTRPFFVEVAFKQKEITVQNRLSHKKEPGLTFHDSIYWLFISGSLVHGLWNNPHMYMYIYI